MQFIKQNLRYYRRYYLLIALAAALANTIITGSLMVGDSVRHTLISRVDERLGRTVTLVSSGSGFMDEDFAYEAAAVFFTNGFVSYGMSLHPVSVWGVDSSLAAIAAQGFVFPDAGEVVINRKTANELSLKIGDFIVVRLPNTGMIPSGSLFVSDNYTTSLRLRVKAVLDSRHSGNLNLRNEQSLPFNLFINRQQLAYELEMDGKCNILMFDRDVSDDELSNSWKPAFSGLTLNSLITNHSSLITNEVLSERVFLDEELVARLNERFSPQQVNHLFSYLVNDIAANGQAVPYSFVTAIDRFAGIELTGNDILLSDYTANRLNASIGDTVTLAFFVSAELKTLSVEEHQFIVKNILPIQALQADGRLSAEYPGLSNVDSCTEWDSDLPIDFEVITQEDEDYWDEYRTTPKALIAYPVGAALWGNSYGVATSVRITSGENWSLSEILSPADAGIVLVSPRETGLAAARGGVDFKSLFLSLAFFVIAAALLLATIPLGGMLHDRRKELQLLHAIGYTQKRIKNIILNEITILTVAATVAGMFFALLYNRLTLFALGNIWKGAVHTENFIASFEPISLLTGLSASLIICFATVWIALQRILKTQSLNKVQGLRFKGQSSKLFPILLLFMFVLIIVNLSVTQSPVLYMATGFIALLVSIMGYSRIVSKKASYSGNSFNRENIVYKNLDYRRRNGIISVAVLASGLFVVFSVGLNRKNFSDASTLLSGTGEFSFWGENSVPLYHSLSTPEGRTRFGLSGLPEDADILQFFRHGGDDASCLNLNKSPQPTVLGVDADRLAESSFTFAATVDGLPDNSSVWEALSHKRGDFYPVIVDQTVLQWGLMKSIGDTIAYLNRRGEPVVLQFIGGLNNSIFQGNLLIDKSFFVELWGEDGSEVMLVQTPEGTEQTVRQLMSQALANYGLQLVSCNERLREFNSVTDSYLTIFLMLGGLGLLIGLFGMLLVVRRGLLDRAREISTLLAIGFDADFIKRQLFRESMAVPVYAVIVGTLAALVAVISAIPAVSLFTWATMLAIIVLLMIIAWWYTKKIVRHKTF